jgi:hypothetical protein
MANNAEQADEIKARRAEESRQTAQRHHVESAG